MVLNVIVVLVGTQTPENAGFVARAMKAFGAKELRLASPQFTLDEASPAYKTASGAHDILHSVGVFSTLKEALADCRHAVAFSRRPHDVFMPEISLAELSQRGWHWMESGPLAMVFGPEDFGLSREDVVLCDAVVRIPMAVESLSLNLAQAVTAALYELARTPATVSIVNPTSAITHEDRERLLAGVIALLESGEFFKPGRKARQIEALRAILRKAELTREEYHTAQGAVNALVRKANRK